MTSLAARNAPLGDINTTPLIDVLLVLIVMLVITVPVASHSVDVDLPSCGANCPQTDLDPVRNRLTVDPTDQVRWNGHPIEVEDLPGILAQTRFLRVEPELQFEPDPAASYDASAHVLAVIKASGVTKFGFVGTERFRNFGS